jgi:hypothetical protein
MHGKKEIATIDNLQTSSHIRFQVRKVIYQSPGVTRHTTQVLIEKKEKENRLLLSHQPCNEIERKFRIGLRQLITGMNSRRQSRDCRSRAGVDLIFQKKQRPPASYQ